MLSSTTRIGLLALLGTLAACAPWPHIEYRRPRVEGRLVDGGKPIPGVEVFLGERPGSKDPCGEAGDRVVVSPIDGRFHISERSGAVYVLSLLNPPSRTGQLTAVCIRRPDSEAQIGALLIMFIDKPMSVSMDCDVSKARGRNEMGNVQASSPLGQAQLCQAVRVLRDVGSQVNPRDPMILKDGED